jgi:hypothetical protein
VVKLSGVANQTVDRLADAKRTVAGE